MLEVWGYVDSGAFITNWHYDKNVYLIFGNSNDSRFNSVL